MDRIEQEINDILEQLDEFPGEEERAAAARAGRGGGAPVSLAARRRKKAAQNLAPTRFLDSISPATLLLGGAGMVVGGLLLSTVVGWLVWVSFAGIVVFLGAFALSFRRRRPGAGGGGVAGQGPRQVFWRDRYIQYEPYTPTLGERVKRLFRRR